MASKYLYHSYYKNSFVTWAPGILSRHLVNGCVLKCSCIGLMVFRNLSCLGIIICYINIIGIIPAYACNVLNVCDAFVQILQPLANVHETKWTRHVKRDCDVAVLIIAVFIYIKHVTYYVITHSVSTSHNNGTYYVRLDVESVRDAFFFS